MAAHLRLTSELARPTPSPAPTFVRPLELTTRDRLHEQPPPADTAPVSTGEATPAPHENRLRANPPTILVTNDDGYDAPGLWALVTAVAPLGHVIVAAPDRQQSWGGRSLRSDLGPGQPITVHPAAPHVPAGSITGWRIGGSPAVCVIAAIDALDVTPDLVVSGINDDHNTGMVITSSGTVGAAWQAASYGIPALAFSASENATSSSLEASIDHVHAICRRALHHGLPAGAAIASINLPDHVDEHTRWTVTHTAPTRVYHHHATPTGSHQWTLDYAADRDCPDHPVPAHVASAHLTDLDALHAGHISITFWPASVGIATGW